MQNLDKTLKCHPEYIDTVIKAFQIYADKNNMNAKDMLLDVTTMNYDLLIKKHKKYKKSTTPYAKIRPPGSSYSFFMKDNYNKIKYKLITENIDDILNYKPTLSDVSKIISKEWNKLNTKMRKKYELLSNEDKKRYRIEKEDVDNKLEHNNINKPKRPQSAFFFYLADIRPKIKKNSPGIKTTDVAKEGRKLWLKMNMNTKNKYNKISNLDKQRYAKEKKAYLDDLENDN
jgi:hypothetical protein